MNVMFPAFSVIVLAVLCTADLESNLVSQLLGTHGRFQKLKQTSAGIKSEEYDANHATDLLLNLLATSSQSFPTAFSNNISSQCKSDSVLYMEQVAHQALSPNSSNRWALRSKINYNHYNYNFELCFYICFSVRIDQPSATWPAPAQFQQQTGFRFIRSMPGCTRREREDFDQLSGQVLHRLLPTCPGRPGELCHHPAVWP